MPPERSPSVERLRWGKITIEGGVVLRDAKLFPGGAREWDWKETGTHHDPGIQPNDVRELIDRGARAIVLSKGMLGRLKVATGTIRLLEEEGIPFEVLPSRKAVAAYNELRGRVPAGALIHSTC